MGRYLTFDQEIEKTCDEIASFLKLEHPGSLVDKKAIVVKFKLPYNRERLIWIMLPKYGIEVNRTSIVARL